MPMVRTRTARPGSPFVAREGTASKAAPTAQRSAATTKPLAMRGDVIVRSGDLGVARTAGLGSERPLVLKDEPETETGDGGAD
jgi:hypothetical protein